MCVREEPSRARMKGVYTYVYIIWTGYRARFRGRKEKEARTSSHLYRYIGADFGTYLHYDDVRLVSRARI